MTSLWISREAALPFLPPLKRTPSCLSLVRGVSAVVPCWPLTFGPALVVWLPAHQDSQDWVLRKSNHAASWVESWHWPCSELVRQAVGTEGWVFYPPPHWYWYPLSFCGGVWGIGEKRKCKTLARLGFQCLGEVFGGFQDSALDSNRGLYKRRRARTPKSSCPVPLCPVPNVASGHLCFSWFHFPPVKNSGKQSFLIKLTVDQWRNSWEWNLPVRAGQLWGNGFPFSRKDFEGSSDLFLSLQAEPHPKY